MNTIVIYKTKYGSTKAYAEWIGEALGCEVSDAKTIRAEDLDKYDTIIYGGGLYAEVINGVSLITKNLDRLNGKKLVVFTTGITPQSCREYYDKLVVEKNFKKDTQKNIKIFNFPGKMVIDELSVVHKAAIKTLKKIMSDKKDPTEMEKMLISLCDANGDFSDKSLIDELINYVNSDN